jgi:glycosyltransferase involved in cell wall biosynthesis
MLGWFFLNEQRVYVSVIVPFFNEKAPLPHVINRVEKALETVSTDYEVIMVDDGSNDESRKIADQLAQENEKLKVKYHPRNLGKSAALNTGFKAAKGKYVVFIDADMQYEPMDIPALLKPLKTGVVDVVNGWRKKRVDPLTKIIPSKIFNLLTSMFFGIKLHDWNCGFKAFKKEVIKNFYLGRNQHRFLIALIAKKGYKVNEVVINHYARRHGQSKYGFMRLFQGLHDLIVLWLLMRN